MKKLRIPKDIKRRKGWNEGGHTGSITVAQWHNNTDFPTALATCADWVAKVRNLDGAPAEGGQVFRSNLPINLGDESMPADMRRKMISDQEFAYSLQLLTAITKGTENRIEEAGHLLMSDIVMSAVVIMGWLRTEEASN